MTRCAVDAAAIRAEPRDDAEQVTQALRGEPLRVEERRQAGWARVVTAYDYPGWLPERALEEGEGALPPPAGAEPLELARTYLGSPYEWGGLTRRGHRLLRARPHRAIGSRAGSCRATPGSRRRPAIPVPVEGERSGDLVTYGAGDRADHVAFWLGERSDPPCDGTGRPRGGRRGGAGGAHSRRRGSLRLECD